MNGREERIRELAHKMWLDEGKPDGRAEQHWERARRLVEVQVQGKPPVNESSSASSSTDSLLTNGSPGAQTNLTSGKTTKALSQKPAVKVLPAPPKRSSRGGKTKATIINGSQPADKT